MQFSMLNYILLLAAVSQIYGYNEPRIFNGEVSPPNLFQFVVTMGGCTGTIISKRHVLTAAHCIADKESLKIEYDRYKVYLKIPYFAEVRPTGRIHDKLKMPMSIKAYLPKTYTWPQWPWNDIALLEFPEGTDFGIEPVKLAKDYIEKVGDEAYIAGFGAWWENGAWWINEPGSNSSGGSDVLRHAKITMVKECYGTLKICGGNETHRALSGDSGGPMLINRTNQWYQIGVSAQTLPYDYRTRISSYCNFIEEVTQNEVKCESIFPERKNMPKLPLKHFEPIYKGQSTPLNLFDFVVPLYNYYYDQGCTATVISKRHLLTNGWCVYREWWTKKYTKIQPVTHSSYKTITGKLFPDFRSKNVQSNFNYDPTDVIAYFSLNYKWPWKHNLAIVEFPEGTDFGIEPVTLPKDCFPIYLKNEFVFAGYGKYEMKKNMHTERLTPILQHSNGSFETGGFTDRKVVFENDNLMKDEGGPMLIERNGKFYQIGVNYREGTPNGSSTSVTVYCNFIEEVTKNEVKCESLIAPIYEMMASEPATALPKKEDKIATPESTNNFSTLVESNILFLISILLFCL